MTEAFRKDTMRTMRKTMNRFCSILLIVALGVGFFAGVRATGDDMRDTASDYYIDYNAMDVKVLSTLGFSENDVAGGGWCKAGLCREICGLPDPVPR